MPYLSVPCIGGISILTSEAPVGTVLLLGPLKGLRRDHTWLGDLLEGPNNGAQNGHTIHGTSNRIANALMPIDSREFVLILTSLGMR